MLKPGGQAEFLELDWTPRCDDQRVTIPRVSEWWRLLQIASQYQGRPLGYPANFETLAAQAGLTVTNHRTIEVRCSETNPRARDTSNTLTRYYRDFMLHEDFKTIRGMSMGLLTRQLRMEVNQVTELCREVRRAFLHLKCPLYHNL